MPVSAIIYGAESGIIRAIVNAENLTDLANAARCRKGEDLIIVNPEEVGIDGRRNANAADNRPNLAQARVLVAAKIGREPENPRCLVIDDKTGDVVEITLADPALDVLPGRTLYQHPQAQLDMALDEETGDLIPAYVLAERQEAEAAATEEADGPNGLDGGVVAQ
jgi:hypothetical protein